MKNNNYEFLDVEFDYTNIQVRFDCIDIEAKTNGIIFFQKLL